MFFFPSSSSSSSSFWNSYFLWLWGGMGQGGAVFVNGG